MTPPNTTNMIPTQNTSFGFGVSESPYVDTPDHLTFEEMREMPMHMALGFDLED